MFRKILLALALACAPAAAYACSACGCLLTRDWSVEGLASNPGAPFHVDVRYDHLDQDELRGGKRHIARAAIALPTDREIEQRTVNNYETLGLDYGNAKWGVRAALPFVIRDHRTIAPGDTDVSTSATRDIGDVRLIGRFQGLPTKALIGVELGVKLPTGGFGDTFFKGPQTGNLVDRGLQAGNGATEAILGLYNFGRLTTRVDYFVHVQGQTPIGHRDDFRPGTQFDGSAGVRMRFGRIEPELQAIVRVAAKDAGIASDRDNSGGTLVDIAPGVGYRASPRVRVYGLVALPVYSYVAGYQLAPHYTATGGARYSF